MRRTRLCTALVVVAALASTGGVCGGSARWADVDLDGYGDAYDTALAAACAAGGSDPRCPRADVNGDGVVDAADVDILDSQPFRRFFDPAQPWVATRTHPGDPGTLYILDMIGDRLHRWSLDRGRMLEPIEVGTEPTAIGWSAAQHRIYVGYLDGTIEWIDPRLPYERVPFTTLAAIPRELLAVESFLYVQEANIHGSSRLHSVYDAAGNLLSSRSDWNGESIRDSQWSISEERIYFVRSYVSPRALHWEHIDPATGAIDAWGQMPGIMDWDDQLAMSSDEERLILESGEVNDLAAGDFGGTLPIEPLDALWLADDTLLTLETEASGGTRLTQWSPGLLRENVRIFPGDPKRVVEHGGRIVVITQGASQPYVTEYVPGADGDGDGIDFASDAFPLEPAASLDSDGDGHPDAWNPGMGPGDSTQGLALDFFPLDAACQLPEHAVPGQPSVCDILAQVPLTGFQDALSDADGIVYLLGSGLEPRIQRYSPATGSYLAPIPVGLGARTLGYAPELGRIYVGYGGNGEVTWVDPALALPLEQPFGSGRHWVQKLIAAGSHLVVNSGWISVFDEDGSLRDLSTEEFYQLTWSPVQARLYYRDGGSHNDLISRSLDPVAGLLGPVLVDPYTYDAIQDPGRLLGVSPDGARVLTEHGWLFDAVTLEVQGVLPTGIHDAVWLADGRLLTIREDAAGDMLVEQWDEELRLADSLIVSGRPVVIVHGGGQVAVLTGDGWPSITPYVAVADIDGDGVATGTDAFPRDPAASVDSDDDGAPDAWNPGMGPGDSTEGLVLDVFPEDFACQLAEHSVGGVCDYRLVVPDDLTDPPCDVDWLPAGATEGYLEIGTTRDMIPLCSGWVLVSEPDFPSGWWIALRNVIDGRVGDLFPLPHEPHQMAYDPERHTVFVGLRTIETLAALDLTSGTVTTHFLGAQPIHQVVDPAGNVYIFTSSSRLWYLPPGGPLQGDWVGLAGTKAVWDAFAGTLLNAGRYNLDRYTFDPATGPVRIDRADVDNARVLAVSPDGAHVLHSDWNGTIVERHDPYDLQTRLTPAFDPAAPVYALSFDADSSSVAVATESAIQVFDAGSQTLLDTLPVPVPGCGAVTNAGWTRGGRLLVGRQSCPSPDPLSRLFWRVLP